MKFKTKIIIFSLLILVLSISAVSAHENMIADGNDTINNDVISINHFDDGLDDLDDGFDDGLDEDDDDSDWEDDSDLDEDNDDSDWEDDSDLDEDNDDSDWEDDSDLDEDDDDDWDDDWDDDLDDYVGHYDWDGNYTNSSIKFCKLISYSREPLIAYKTASSLENLSYGDSYSEKDCEDICGEDSDGGLDDNSDDLNDDSQEESGLDGLQSFMTACPGDSASFEVPDALSQNHESVSKNINQGQNLLDDEKGNNVDVNDDKDNETITFSSDNDLDVLGLLVSLLLCIILLI